MGIPRDYVEKALDPANIHSSMVIDGTRFLVGSPDGVRWPVKTFVGLIKEYSNHMLKNGSVHASCVIDRYVSGPSGEAYEEATLFLQKPDRDGRFRKSIDECEIMIYRSDYFKHWYWYNQADIEG